MKARQFFIVSVLACGAYILPDLLPLACMAWAAAGAPDIRDIRAPLSPEWLFPAIVFALTAVLLVLCLFPFLKRIIGHATSVPKSAYEAAIDAITALNGNATGVVGELSQIIRQFTERALNIKATAMTTEEFLTAIKAVHPFSDDQFQRLQAFMRHCEHVQYAGYRPDSHEIPDSIAAALEIMETLNRPLR